MTGHYAISATALSKQVNVSQSTLSKWLHSAGVDPNCDLSNNTDEYTKITKIMNPKCPNDWSAEDKLKFVLESASLPDEQIGAFLRSKGLHHTHLEQWRLHMLKGLQNDLSSKKTRKRNTGAKRVRALEFVFLSLHGCSLLWFIRPSRRC